MPRSGPGPVTRSPLIRTCPIVGVSKPAIIRSKVDLPQPEAPIRQINSPRPIERSTERNASISPPLVAKRLWTPSMRRIGSQASAGAGRARARGRSTRSAMLRAPAKHAPAHGADALIGEETGEPDHDHPGDNDIGARHLARVLDHRAQS